MKGQDVVAAVKHVSGFRAGIAEVPGRVGADVPPAKHEALT